MMSAENLRYNSLSEEIRDEFFRTGSAEMVLARRTAAVDERVLSAFGEHLGVTSAGNLALVAVGGYGRRELFPHSDVDLLILCDDAHKVDGLSLFLQSLWDTGLRLSHSVRTVNECCQLQNENPELSISLLNARYLAGGSGVFADLFRRFPRFLHGQRDDLSRALVRLTRSRHAKYSETLFHLEPNIKETPGGLRDLQTLLWMKQIRSTDLDRLAPAEWPAELEADRWFLYQLRCWLHYQAMRDNNSLGFDSQDWVAGKMGASSAAAWMRDYFLHARAIFRLTQRELELVESRGSGLFSSFRNWRSRLSNTDFTVLQERVHLRSSLQPEGDPDLILRLFQFAARHGLRPSRDTEQRVALQLPLLARLFRGTYPLWPPLQELLSLDCAHTALRSMHEIGLLRTMFPELDLIDCLVIRDFYHRYTVDEHTFLAIEVLSELRRNKEGEGRLFSEILSEFEQISLLAFALLFHDVGKGAPSEGENHCSTSSDHAEKAMERIQMPPRDRDLVQFLIRHHLDMFSVMLTRDLDDPATGRFMADQVETVERLKALTLMTYCDLSAVNPTAMSPWRREQLWHLYLLTFQELTRELDADRIEAAPGLPEPVAGFLLGFPTRYRRTHSQAEMERHYALDQTALGRGVASELNRLNHVYEITVVTKDRPFLFASIAGALSSFGMNILKAEAFGNRRGTILDTFTFADPLRTLELNPSEQERLQALVERVALGKADVAKLLKSRPMPHLPGKRLPFRPAVAFDNEASATATLVHVVAPDRPGLLYDLAHSFSAEECNIEVVLVDTESFKAMDVFYVTRQGGKLDQERQGRLSNSLLAACHL